MPLFQYFFPWETPTTFQNWQDAGLNYDTTLSFATLSFADVAGFRCGVCYEFPTFNLKNSPLLKLRNAIKYYRHKLIA